MIPESKYSNSRRRRTQLDSACASKDQNLISGGLLGSGRCDSEVVHRRNLPSTPMSTSAVPRHSDHRSHLHCGAFRHVERYTLPIPRDEAICRPRVVEPRHLQIVEIQTLSQSLELRQDLESRRAPRTRRLECQGPALRSSKYSNSRSTASRHPPMLFFMV